MYFSCMKRGAVELGIVLAVLIVGVFGLFFSLTGSYVARDNPYPPYTYPGGESPMKACEERCAAVEPGNSKCIQQCRLFSSIGDPYAWHATGEFAVPGAQEYGGAIRGVGSDSTRAFSGRAYDMPPQSCYDCTCTDVDYSSPTMDAAQKACANNCGGSVKKLKDAPCY
jgi:hypothetical protein